MTYLQALVLAFIEGFTEFLPISSTGHLIVGSYFMGINEDVFTKQFNIIIQSGAILAVLTLYFRKFLSGTDFYKKLVIGFLPAAVIGFLVKDYIDGFLGSVVVVAYALIAGGVILLFIDRVDESNKKNQRQSKEVSLSQALKIGLFQCLAFIPGVSRSGATIVASIFQGIEKRTAAEFSFFLAVPTLCGATALKVFKMRHDLDSEHLGLLLFGSLVAYIVALASMRAFVTIVSKFGLKFFGFYRIALGVALLLLP